MYNNPYNRMLQSEIENMDNRGIQNMRNIESGYGSTGYNVSGNVMKGGARMSQDRMLGGVKKRGRPSKKATMQGAGFLDFMEDFGKGFIKGFTGAADVAGKVLPVVAPFIGLGKGQKKYKKQSMSGCAMPMSGMAAGTFRDTGFGTQMGAVGGLNRGIIKPMTDIKFGGQRRRGRPSKKMMQGEGIISDVIGMFGLGKSGGQRMTLKQLERMGSMPPKVMRDRSMNLGSSMSGMGRSGGASKFKPINFDEEEDDDELASIMGSMSLNAPRQRTRRLARAPMRVPSVVPAKRKGEKLENPRRKTKVVEGEGFSGGRRTEQMGDFSGMGFSGGAFMGMGSSGGKKAPNAWIKLVNEVRKKHNLKGVKEAIAYIKQHNLYKK